MSHEKSVHLDSRESDDGSIDHSDTPPTKSGAKRRASRAGTRSVATLNPEQLARKRANDREAQRSIRQRTKDHINNLEQRIAALSGDHQDERIDDVQRRNEELEVEVKMLRKTLGRVEDAGSMSSSPELQPPISSYNINRFDDPGLYAYPPIWNSHNTYTTSRILPTSFPSSRAGDLMSTLASPYTSSYPLNPGSSLGLTPKGNGSRLDISMTEAMAPGFSIPIAQNRRETLNNSRPNFGRSRSYPNGSDGRIATLSTMGHSHQPISPLTTMSRMSPSINDLIAPTLPIQQPLLQLALLSATSIIEESENGIIPSPALPQQSNSASFNLPPPFIDQPSLHMWELQIRFIPPTSPVDSILLGLLERERSAALGGTISAEVTSLSKPSLRALIQPGSPDPTHPISSVLAELLHRTPVIGLAAKAAALVVMFAMIQWQILPSPESYNNLPEFCTPRASQLLTPHPIWATFIAWGKLRDIVIGDQERYITEEFQHTCMASLNVNWPYRNADILVFEEGQVRVTDAFASHVGKLSSWSLDRPFQVKYPELRELCKFTEYPDEGFAMQH